jgi:hypothetical protein
MQHLIQNDALSKVLAPDRRFLPNRANALRPVETPQNEASEAMPSADAENLMRWRVKLLQQRAKEKELLVQVLHSSIFAFSRDCAHAAGQRR